VATADAVEEGPSLLERVKAEFKMGCLMAGAEEFVRLDAEALDPAAQ